MVSRALVSYWSGRRRSSVSHRRSQPAPYAAATRFGTTMRYALRASHRDGSHAVSPAGSSPGGLGRIGSILTFGSLAVLAAATAIEFWPFPWGSYSVTFETATLPRLGGLIQSLGTVILTLGLLLWSIDLARATVIPAWMVPVLLVGGLSSFFLTPTIFIPGLACLFLGAVVWFRERLAIPSV